ncbi:hypothetical protein H4219_001515 [Mycoemilia scoparia]|uniref:DUF300-domain-containing protein n=1 Tax=Mycoemilia scoparia TaxID=417184 RepID=A0A9W8A082_9FUNG|nr:hypothetical protein H4219_001515 [Mycoemilia scoparia]
MKIWEEDPEVTNVQVVGHEGCWVGLKGNYNLAWYELSRHKLGWLVSGVLALLATLISVFLICLHLRNYRTPKEQRYIIRIVLLLPVFSIGSWLSYRFFHKAIYFEALRDLYEALALYFFMVLLFNYIGTDKNGQPDTKPEDQEQGELLTQSQSNAIVASEQAQSGQEDNTQENHEAVTWPFPYSCKKINLKKSVYIVAITVGMFQYCLIKVILTAVIIISQFFGRYCPQSWSPKYASVWVTVINFISVSVALYYLFALYLIVKKPLYEKKPGKKFAAIKLVVFFAFWQKLILQILSLDRFNIIKQTNVWTKEDIVNGLNSLLICFEMFCFSIFYFFAFSWKDYKLGPNERRYYTRWKLFNDAFNMFDIFRHEDEYGVGLGRMRALPKILKNKMKKKKIGEEEKAK